MITRGTIVYVKKINKLYNLIFFKSIYFNLYL